jgi:IMP dehydrogenase
MRECEAFFRNMKQLGLALAYGDVRLLSNYSDLLPAQASVESRFSRNVPLKIPIVSAAMDTVTESRMAIALAKLGGIGVIHRGLSAKQQGEEARRVKFHLSGLIVKPISVREDATIESVENLRRDKEFSFHSFPVIDDNGKLIGIITQNDFDFCGDQLTRVSDIMTRDLIEAPVGTSIDDAYQLMLSRKKKVLPLVDSNGTLAGMYLFSDLKRIKSGTSDSYNMDVFGRLRVAAAIGVRDDALERVEALHSSDDGQSYVDAVVIDTAHGDTKDVFETIAAIKKSFGDIDVVAGNVSRGASASRLVAAGADGIKVGQGPGSICITRIVAGVGSPQVTAIYEVAEALERSDVPICADGGISQSGDIPIAIGAGAHSVMLGRLIAGTKETPGEVIFRGGNPIKPYRGMGSLAALEASQSSRERYRQEDAAKDRLVPEGVEGAVPYAAELLETLIHQYVGGLRKGMGYVGAHTIEELRQRAEFNRITSAGMQESHPHGISILKEPPNYRLDEK